jgi:glucose-1-phosphate adenylyltransferase
MDRLTERTLVLILCGGKGERLYPLTKDRAKPSVPFLGAYRMIDFSLSNCLNSGLRRIALLTQYKSLSLERHILLGWNIFHAESRGFIMSLPAQGRVGDRWYEGTADAVFQNIYTIQQENPDAVLNLSGDHVYKADYGRFIEFARDKSADAVLMAKPVPRMEARRFGVLHTDGDGRITEFVEKPKNPPGIPGDPTRALASMGIYFFRTVPLIRALIQDAKSSKSGHDFGKDILPRLIGEANVFAYPHEGYWEDIGTIDAYWTSHMAFLSETPPFPIQDPAWPVRTYQGQHPPALIDGSSIRSSLVGPGCAIRGASLSRSILSPGVVIGEGASVEDSIVFEGVRIGRDAHLRKCIIDKNSILPDGARIIPGDGTEVREFRVYGDGIRIVPRGWRPD